MKMGLPSSPKFTTRPSGSHPLSNPAFGLAGMSRIMGPSTTTKDTSSPTDNSNRPRSTTTPDTNTIPNSASDDGGANGAPSDTTDDVRLDDGRKGIL